MVNRYHLPAGLNYNVLRASPHARLIRDTGKDPGGNTCGQPTSSQTMDLGKANASRSPGFLERRYMRF